MEKDFEYEKTVLQWYKQEILMRKAHYEKENLLKNSSITRRKVCYGKLFLF